MPRRPHKKSRAGCFSCKKRHVKCDEGRPRCINCQTAGLECVFASNLSAPGTPAIEPKETPASVSETSTPDQYCPPQSQFGVPSQLTAPAVSDPTLNMQHLELLHQFTTFTHTTFSEDQEVLDVWKIAIPRMALSHPFLMYELLGMAALHLAYCRPAFSTQYYTQATELQTQALNSFNSVPRAVDASNCGAFLIFSTLLAVHVLADPSRTVDLDSNRYLDHVIHCFMLMRNVRQLIIHEWYESLRISDLKPLFSVSEPARPYQIPEPCLDLVNLIDNPELGEKAREGYSHAIERLQWTFAISKIATEKHVTVRWLLAWPIQLEAFYQDSLDQRRPEALVILAYFAVILLFYRDCWVIGDSGQFLIKAISSHLGPRWSGWMKWPLSFVTPMTGTG